MINNHCTILQAKKTVLALCIILLPYTLWSADTATFFELANFNGKEIQIRGFLYQTEDKKLILAALPNLKSCCVGTASQRSQQIVVEGDIPAQHIGGKLPVLLEGLLEQHPQRDFEWLLLESRMIR